MLDLETGLASRGDGDRVLDESSERALEIALAHLDANPESEVIAVTVGPASSESSLRKALAMGATSAIIVADEHLVGADIQTTVRALELVIRQQNCDLIIAGNLTTDGMGGVVPAMLAEKLGLPNLTSLSSVNLGEKEVSGKRSVEFGTQEVSATYPVVISVTEAVPDPRFPNFKGIMAAKKKEIHTLSLSDLASELPDLQRPLSIMLSVTKRPARQSGEVIIDEDGNSVNKIIEVLRSAGVVSGTGK